MIMAGDTSFTSIGEAISFYFSHWNTDYVSLSILMVGILMLSGYFWGRLIQHYAKSLKNADCTFLGIFVILGLFQIEIFFSICLDLSTEIAFYFLPVLLSAGPVLCLITRSDVLPSWKHLVSLLAGIAVTVILCKASAQWTTNNIFYDSITYLSEVLENAKASVFGHIDYTSGYHYEGIENLHDFQGYYYFWSILLRWAVQLTGFSEILTPLYIWGATILYGMSLGNLTVSSVNVLYRTQKWKGLIFAVLILSPYFTNYFNTTLGFFGNTIRTIIIGWSVLIVFRILKEKNRSQQQMLYASAAMTYLAGISVSSSSLFIDLFLCVGLFFALCWAKEKNRDAWNLFIFSCVPVIFYGILITLGHNSLLRSILFTAAITAALMGIVFLLQKHLDVLCRVCVRILPVLFAVLVGLTVYLNRSNGFSDMMLYFSSPSAYDMEVNLTSHTSTYELIRNLILYVLIALLFVNLKKENRFKFFLIVLGILFLNPFSYSPVTRYLTSSAYFRAFDLIINPFTLIFLIWNADKVLSFMSFVLLGIAGVFSAFYAHQNLTEAVSSTLVSDREDWNWETKVTDDDYELYDYIQNNISDAQELPEILSQDINLRGYTTDVISVFSSIRWRTVLSDPVQYQQNYNLVTLLYPNTRFASTSISENPDYSKLPDVIKEYGSDYVIISNTISVWDDRGWYDKAYVKVVNSGQCSLLWENDSWAILKVNHDWSAPNKNETRYWVHKLEIPES